MREPERDMSRLEDILSAINGLKNIIGTVPFCHKPRLYDHETGEYLNDKTMKIIEDVRSGKEPVFEMKSMDEFKAWCESL